MPRTKYKIVILAEGPHHSGDTRVDVDTQVRLFLRDMMNHGHTIESAHLHADGEDGDVSSHEDVKPKHHQLTAEIVVDKIYASLSPAELMRGIESGEIPVKPKGAPVAD